MSKRIYKIAAVSYINTIPMLEGFNRSGIANEIELILAAPSECARLFDEDRVDIALMPVAAIPTLDSAHVITDICIGCEGAVRTVALMSNKRINEIKNVQLDADSRTSNLLIQVLAKEFFKRDWIFLQPVDILENQEEADAVLAIGDKVFELENQFSTIIDLGKAWSDFVSLPFVFAVWVSRKPIHPMFEKRMNDALKLGIDAIPEMALPDEEMRSYLEHSISFPFDSDKKLALQLFLKKIGNLNEVSTSTPAAL